MIQKGLLNPQILSLLARVRHTNRLVIADRGFPSWPGVETIDLSLIDDVPTVLQVVQAVRANWSAGAAFMAQEFKASNTPAIQDAFAAQLEGLSVTFEPHVAFKTRVPAAIGLIRTGDTTQYGNIILESA